MKHYNIPIFISHFGCPNDCVFCNQRKINGMETDVTAEDVKNTIETYLKTLPKKSKKEVAFFGGTFTGISLNLQREYLSVVKEYIDRGLVDGVRLSTRPDYIDEKIVKMLLEYGVTVIELGVQSLDEEVLKKTHRFYKVDKVYEASNIIKRAGIDLGIQLMLGLPGSTKESDLESAKKVLEIRPELARIYPTLVIKDTDLAKQYKEREYIPLTIEEAVDRCKEIYSLFELNNINVIRVGLQATDDLSDKENVLGGPYHPAFRELVEGEIYFDFIKSHLKEGSLEINIQCNEKDVSKIVGINKKNKERFGKNFSVKIDNLLVKGAIKLNDVFYTREEILKGEVDESNSHKY